MITTLYEPFRHWSDGGSVYILSDTHFDDADCKLMDPGWITPEEQVDIINSLAGKGYSTRFIQAHCLYQIRYCCHTSRCMVCLGV